MHVTCLHFQRHFEEGGGIMVLEDSRCGARWFAIDICLSAHIFLKLKRYVVLMGCQFWQEGVGTW